MKDVKDITCCVVDGGLFLPFARRMAEECSRVLFCNPFRQAYPTLRDASIGDGFDDIESIDCFWDYLPEIDLFCVPDVGHGPLQNHLREIGKPVWGSGYSEQFELDRPFFHQMLAKLGLEVPPHEIFTGITDLATYLHENEDQYIKISRYRGDMETTHWRNWKTDWPWLDWLAVRLGPFKNHMKFMVFPAINTPLEIGGDTYNVRTQWPSTMINGLEHKDTTYFGSVSKRSDMPPQIQEILEAFGPYLEHATQWSMEVRIKDDKAYFTDATVRGGMPSSASQQLLWRNFPEIIWAGANGELVDPEPEAKFSIECMVTIKEKGDTYDLVELPAELERWVRFSGCAFVDDCYAFPPDETRSGDLGWLCAIGDTPRETLALAKELADGLPDGLDANLENLVGLIKEVEEGEKQGIPMTQGEMPEPAEVIED